MPRTSVHSFNLQIFNGAFEMLFIIEIAPRAARWGGGGGFYFLFSLFATFSLFSFICTASHAYYLRLPFGRGVFCRFLC